MQTFMPERGEPRRGGKTQSGCASGDDGDVVGRHGGMWHGDSPDGMEGSIDSEL